MSEESKKKPSGPSADFPKITPVSGRLASLIERMVSEVSLPGQGNLGDAVEHVMRYATAKTAISKIILMEVVIKLLDAQPTKLSDIKTWVRNVRWESMKFLEGAPPHCSHENHPSGCKTCSAPWIVELLEKLSEEVDAEQEKQVKAAAESGRRRVHKCPVHGDEEDDGPEAEDELESAPASAYN